jgi:hypothetical protein
MINYHGSITGTLRLNVGSAESGCCVLYVWFLESMVKMVKWNLSLIINRAPRVQFPWLLIDTGSTRAKIIQPDSQNLQVDVHDREKRV